MASLLHEVLVDLFRESPGLLAELSVGPLARWVRDPSSRFECDVSTFSRVPAIESDLVLVIRGPRGERRCVLVFEVQLGIDPDKYRSWPCYQADAYRRHGCPSYVVVFTLDPRVAAWAAGPIRTGQTELRPIVIGPRSVPQVFELSVERATVEFSVVSGLAHHDQPEAVKIGEVLWRALTHSENPRADLYWDVFLSKVGEATRRSLMLRLQNYRPQSEWGKGIYAKGRVAGRVEGKAEGTAEALLVLMDARALMVSAEVRARIERCREPQTLGRWLRRAATATTVDEVFRG